MVKSIIKKAKKNSKTDKKEDRKNINPKVENKLHKVVVKRKADHKGPVHSELGKDNHPKIQIEKAVEPNE